MTILNFIIGVLVGALVIGGGFFVWRSRRKLRLMKSLRMTSLLVQVPKESTPESERNPDRFKTDINRFEQFLSALASLKQPFALEIAVPHVGEEIHFYLAVPRLSSETATKHIQGIWNGASVVPAPDDYNIFNAQGASTAAYLMEKQNYALPLRTYQEIGADTFSSVLGAFAKVNEIGEGLALQVIARPAPREASKSIHHYIVALRKGEALEEVFKFKSPIKMSDFQGAFNPRKQKEKRQEQKIEKEKMVDEESVKALEGKLTKPLFQVNVRIVSSAASQFQAADLLDGLAAGFTQFGGPHRNEFKLVRPRKPDGVIREFIYRTWNDREAMTLSSEEIASFYHFPIAATETPRVKWLKAKEAAPPVELPTDGVLLGESVFRGQRKSIYVTDDDRRRHIYVVGQTGTGKSTLLGNMVSDDIKKGKGVALIDPHGDLVEEALSHVPSGRTKDVIYFDTGDLERPLGLNMIDYNFSRPEEKTFIVNEMQNIFNKLFPPETMGPMFEQYMRNALLLLMEDMPNEPATLVEVPRIFTDPDYRERKLARIQNPVVIDFWEKEAIKAGGEASLANMTPYITSKFNNFIANDYMRPIIGQPKSSFNFREMMDQGKILLINLSKGRIGDINANLLGMIFSGKILMAALSRVDIPRVEDRRDFNLYIDEFQNFTTDSIATILSEARKYRLNLTIAHQFIAQLTEHIRDAVFGNVGSMLAMRVGTQDAEFLVKQFEPVFNQNDLLNIENFNAYAKILIHGQPSKPFNIRTLPPEPGNRDQVDQLKELSRTTYGQDRKVIEEEIYKRLRE